MKLLTGLCIFSLFHFISVTVVGQSSNFTDIVQTDDGPVQGIIEDGIQIFHGIPFAAPPVGDFRLRSPQPANAWRVPRECFIPPSMCPQFDDDNNFIGKEDCLYLSVYVPVKASKTPRPVIFWIYGGGYTIGDGWEFAKYDAKNITNKHDYIFVSHNYRLGALGFLALDELRAESSSNSTGNYALQDQRAALQWVQRNIHAFGGDPTQVTIFGESAGAFSTCWHMASPMSKGLFKAAIMESGTCDSTMFFLNYERASSWSQLHSKTVGCDPSDSKNLTTCLRTVTAQKLDWVKKDLYNETDYFLPLLYPIMPWGPVIDGSPEGLVDMPLTQLKNNKGLIVPYIGGTNDNEGSIFVGPMRLVIPAIHQPMTEDDVAIFLDHFFCDNETIVDTILAAYPLANFKDPDHQTAIIIRDWFFVCPTRRAHHAIYNVNPKYPWMYHFAYEMHWPSWNVTGDYHSSELNFVFDNWWPLDEKPWDDADQKMADTFGVYWSNLVWNNNTNGPRESVPLQWPNWDPTNENNIVMDVPASLQSHYQNKECQMWDNLGPMCEYCGCS